MLAYALFGVLVAPARAQVAQDAQIWTGLVSTARLGQSDSGPSLWLDAHLRRSGTGTVHILRPAIGWGHKGWLSAWAGYAWIPVLPDEGDTAHEHRLWQQLIVQRGAGQLSLQLRSRFEERFSPGSEDVGFRLREFGRAGWALKEDGDYGLVAWDEIFLGLNQTDWGAPAGFDQNRLFAGVFVKADANLRLELGYLSVYLNRDEDTLGHALATNVFVSL